MISDDQATLPDIWTRPRPDTQPTLFPEPVEKSLRELRVTRNDINRWREEGWISFDIDTLADLDWPQQNEIAFVRSLATSGLSACDISKLVSSLSRPFAFNPRYIAYHFDYGWVIPAEKDPFEVVEENISEWLEDLASRGEHQRLGDLADQITELLSSLTDDDGELDSEEDESQASDSRNCGE